MKTRRIVYLSILLAIATVIGYLESLIPAIGIPGVKLGLANIIILLTILNFKWYESLIILLLRILLVSLILGTFLNVGFLMSLSGGVLSYLMMLLLTKVFKNLSVVFVSISGAVIHSIGQIIVAIIVTSTPQVIYYLPFILLLSIPTGILTGIIALRLNKYNLFGDKNERKEERE